MTHTAAEADAFLASIERSVNKPMQVDAGDAPPARTTVLAGDDITAQCTAAGFTVKLGQGVHQCERTGEAVVASRAGVLRHARPNRWRVDGSMRRYVPLAEDAVVGTVVGRSGTSYRVDIGAAAPALLDTLAFDGATKRNRPQLEVGALVYARVALTRKDMDTQLTCRAPEGAPRRDWTTFEALFQELKEGHVFAASTGLARALLGAERGGGAGGANGDAAEAPPTGPESVLGVLGSKLAFELAIGANGRVWVNSPRAAHTILVANAIRGSEHCASAEAVEEMVAHLMAAVGPPAKR